MKIAVVDDSKTDREELKAALTPFFSTLDFEVEICEFGSAEDFLAVFEPAVFDLCFMDIYMNALNGMEAAKIVAAKDPACFVIFLTTSADYIAEGYDVRAWRYIIKPLKPEAVAKMLTPCIEKIELSKRFLTLSMDRQTLRLPFSKIYYVVTANRSIEIHLKEETLTLSARTRFSEIAQPLLADYRFFACGKGIVINFAQTQRIEAEGALLRNGKTAPISKRKISEVKTAFMQYSFQNL
ncbi:LytR/AlgR family response regulator transcription factor [Acidaminobacterium chupaoyuni]